MNDDLILAGIEDVARKHIGWDGAIEPNMRLVEDLSLDSIKLLTLAMEVENHFKVCLDPEKDNELQTIGDLIAAIRRQLLEPTEVTKQTPKEKNGHDDTKGSQRTE